MIWCNFFFFRVIFYFVLCLIFWYFTFIPRIFILYPILHILFVYFTVLYSSSISSLKSGSVVGSDAMIILECANILESCTLKYPCAPRRPRMNRISFLACDNASSGVIAPWCVYIDGISMASKEFMIAKRSRYLIYRGLSERTKTRSAPILICSPWAARYSASSLVPLNHSFARIARSTVVTIRMSDITSSRISPYLFQWRMVLAIN